MLMADNPGLRYLYAATLCLSILVLSNACEEKPTKEVIGLETVYRTQCDMAPDGHTIAAAWSGEPSIRPWGLYLIDTLGWSIEPLFVPNNGVTNFSSPSWSPDGEWLAFGYGIQIFKIKRNGDSLTQLTDFGEQFYCDWSPADTAIISVVAVGAQAGTWIYDKSGNNARPLILSGNNAIFVGSDTVLYSRNKPSNMRDSAQLLVRNILDGGERLLFEWHKGEPYLSYYLPEISPNHQRLVASADGYIVSLSMEGDDLRVLTSSWCFYPAWSTDGSKIIFNYDPIHGEGSLWIMKADGTDKRQIPGW